MKKLFFLLAVFLFVGLYFFQFQAPEENSSTQKKSTAVPKKASPSIQPSSVKKTVSSKRTTAKSSESGSTQVPFKVIDGYAVAYGDILLGTPEDTSLTEGIFDAPKPDLWDSEIAYHIQSEVPNEERIRSAMDYLEKHSGLHFVPYQDQKDAIFFEKAPKHCLSLLGRQGGLQPIRLSDKCSSQEILHELLHALGFVHEHSRVDRDNFVEIVWDNVDPEYRLQFEKVPEVWMAASAGTPFDPTSVMMYGSTFFAKQEGLQTIRPKGKVIIQPTAKGLSSEDRVRLQKLYPH